MSVIFIMCPLYLENKTCLVKFISNPELISNLGRISLPLVNNQWRNDCHGDWANCSFKEKEVVENVLREEIVEQTKEEEKQADTKVYETVKTAPIVSMHQVANPYLVKADAIVCPTNIILTIDDAMLHKMSFGKVQKELDLVKKPIHMGTVYETTNGGEKSRIVPLKIFHAVVAGESRLVNEEDIKSATRKALLLADMQKLEKISMIPADCGTYDINDTARVQLAAIMQYFAANKNTGIKRVFLLMEDKESLESFQEYYKRVFKN